MQLHLIHNLSSTVSSNFHYNPFFLNKLLFLSYIVRGIWTRHLRMQAMWYWCFTTSMRERYHIRPAVLWSNPWLDLTFIWTVFCFFRTAKNLKVNWLSALAPSSRYHCWDQTGTYFLQYMRDNKLHIHLVAKPVNLLLSAYYRSPLPVPVKSILEEGIDLFQLHSRRHGRWVVNTTIFMKINWTISNQIILWKPVTKYFEQHCLRYIQWQMQCKSNNLAKTNEEANIC